jgi:hypothetical protein
MILFLMGLFVFSAGSLAAQEPNQIPADDEIPIIDATPTPTPTPSVPTCSRTVTANVVAIDQVYTYNRFGAFNPAGMVYALQRDVVGSPGNWRLKDGKRPRPLTLRVNEGECLQVSFTNLLNDPRPHNDSTKTRNASIHVNGLDYVGTIASDGAFVGKNAISLAAPGETRIYKWYASKQGQYLFFSMGAPAGAEGDIGQGGLGLFGSVNVEPKNSKWYRSQVTAAQLQAATIGTNPNGTPVIDYEKVGPDGFPLLNVLYGTEIIHSDLNAIITDPTGVLQENCTKAPPSGTCGEPFREFTVIFHDEIKAVQAFKELNQPLFHGVRDGFAINYGASAVGSTVLANRKKLGPGKDCGECKFEEFFLESWVSGDPAMNVRRDSTGKAVEALFPDDPSNVHHSYLGDPVRFRNLHIGAETHVFHLHAHQWLQSPRDENSTYLDSQTISPGAAFTYEINYGGSGNRNFNPGDAIFHCHLYPHFAQGMWELWRNHDVFEAGTPDRNLPDAEIAGGTPNPAIVPIPGKPMPLMPTAAFKGFPFYVAATAGHRPSQPPYDIDWDGGLPRHRVEKAPLVVDGPAAIDPVLLTDPVASRVLSQNPDPNLLAFARKALQLDLKLLPQNGTTAEVTAIKFHENANGVPVTNKYGWTARGYNSYTSSGAPGLFLVNGLPPQPGGAFADPCKVGVPQRSYRAAYIQFDMTVNRAKWHDRQARITVLEQDVTSTLSGSRRPEPFFFRANSNDCVTFKVTNLVPGVLNLDDFQVFTPTDTIGQHIHLVKFDVMTADGSGNGWNYEDGTFSADEVRERIEANNAYQTAIGGTQFLTAKVHPSFGGGPGGHWVGAQTTVQRWWADPLVNTLGRDRTIRTVFTHDHFGPSSHQQHGMYAALVVEPTGSTWKGLNGVTLGTRTDGGPTSYAANIIPPDQSKSYREFNLAFADFAIVYRPDLTPVNPPGRQEAPLPIAIEPTVMPMPEAISAADPGTQLINYRNEPIPLRVGKLSSGQFIQKTGKPGDLAYAFSSKVHNDPFTPILTAYEGDRTMIRMIQGAQEEQHVFNLHGFKWLFEPSAANSGYRNAQQIGISEHFEVVLDPVPQVTHDPSILGTGFTGKGRNFVDHLYSSAATDNLWDGQWGILRMYKGVQPSPVRLAKPDSALSITSEETIQTLSETQTELIASGEMDADAPIKNATNPDGSDYLAPLPNNPTGEGGTAATSTTTESSTTTVVDPTVARSTGDPSLVTGTNVITNSSVTSVCPSGAFNRPYDVHAYLARDLLPGGSLVYNNRFGIKDPNAILYVEQSDIAGLQAGTKLPEPLILRAAAGDCVKVTLTSHLPTVLPESNSWNMMPMIVNGFNFNQVRTSNRIGLHSQLLSSNTFTDDGASVGFNLDSLVAPGGTRTYTWYAGNRVLNSSGYYVQAPVEFGATGLRDMGDVIKHASHGATGALMIEPTGTNWSIVGGKKASADIKNSAGSVLFREFVMLYQDDLSVQRNGEPLENIAETDDSENSGMKAFNYRTEPLWGRLGVDIDTPPTGAGSINDLDLTNILSSNASNPGCGGPCGDPETPVFTATTGTPVRFRVVQTACHPRQHGFTLFGHHWNFEPWQQLSTVQGNNPFTFEIGSESGIGPTRHINILTTAGGLMKVKGDYLYRTQESFNFGYGGLWGIFRVNAPTSGGGGGVVITEP